MKKEPKQRKNKREEPWDIDIDQTILYLGMKNYSIKYFTNGSFKIFACTLKRIEEFFASDKRFIRISKSCLINCQYLKRKSSNRIIMIDNKTYIISRRRVKEVERKLELIKTETKKV